ISDAATTRLRRCKRIEIMTRDRSRRRIAGTASLTLPPRQPIDTSRPHPRGMGLYIWYAHRAPISYVVIPDLNFLLDNVTKIICTWRIIRNCARSHRSAAVERGAGNSLRLRAREPDDLAPFFRLVGHELPELGGRDGEHRGAELAEPLFQPG